MKNDNIEKIQIETLHVINLAIAHRHKPDVLDEALRQIALALGLVISLAAHGDSELMDELVSKTKKIAHDEADRWSPLCSLMEIDKFVQIKPQNGVDKLF